MVTTVNSLVLGNAEVHNYHLNSDVFGSSAGTVAQGNTSFTVSTTGSLSGGGTITMGAGGSITINYNEPTNVSHFTNDANYTSVGDGLSVFTNNVGYVVTGSNISVFSNDVGYVTASAGVSTFSNDANYVSSGDNVSVFVNDAGYLTTETDPTVGAHIKAITTTEISNWNIAYSWGDHSLEGYFVGSSTDDLVEGTTNLYFTDERVDDRVSALLVAGTNISLVYNDIANTLTINASGVDLSGSTTDDLSEGSTNLYFTTARAKASLSGGTGVTYSSATGSISIGQDVSTTANVQFGNIQTSSISTLDYADFDTALVSSPSFVEGRLFYDNVNKTMAFYNQEPDVTLQIGQEQWIRVYNNSGATIDNGKPVYITGSTSGWPTVALANANSVSTFNAIGLATHSIEDATYGYVTTKGVVRDVNTSSLSTGVVHLGVTDGALQNQSPTYPNYPHEIGYCIVSDATNGSIYVDIQQHTIEVLRTFGDARIDGDLTIVGDFNVLGNQTVSTITNLEISDNFVYLNAGDTIGADNTNFTGTGLDDAAFVGHYKGTSSQTYYVRIDSTGTPDTFEWSLDNFSTTEATGVAITGNPQELIDGISIEFTATTGHTLNDVWSGIAAPVNIDVGIISNRNTGATGVGYTHVGVFFDVTDQKFKFFDEYEPEVDGTIDPSDTSFSLAVVNADTFEGNIDWSYVQNTPDPTITVSLSGDVSGSGNATFTDFGNGTITVSTVVANDSHTHDGRYFTETESDARYAPISHTHAYDNYGGWYLSVNAVDRGQITSGERVSFEGGSNVSLSYSTTNNVITINATDTWRPIHDTPVDGATTTSISSNWAFDHAALTSVHGSTNLNTASRIVQRDASGNFSAGTITAALSGNASTASKWQTARTITLGGDLAGNVAIDGSANATLTATIVANSVALGTDTTGNYVSLVDVSGNGLGITGIAGEDATFVITSNATSANTPNTIVYRDASGNFSAGVITATATQARYADLAEKYTTEVDHPVGTVMMVGFSDEYETEPCNIDGFPVGIVSEKPAILMNESIDGQALALKGRVPVRIIGPVKKGQKVYVAGNGLASTIFNGKPIVGVALETNTMNDEKLVECVVMI